MRADALCVINESPLQEQNDFRDWFAACQTSGFLIHPKYVLTTSHKEWTAQAGSRCWEIGEQVWLFFRGDMTAQPPRIRQGRVAFSEHDMRLDAAVIRIEDADHGSDLEPFEIYVENEIEESFAAVQESRFAECFIYRWQGRHGIGADFHSLSSCVTGAIHFDDPSLVPATFTLTGLHARGGESGSPICDAAHKVIGFIVAGTHAEDASDPQTYFLYTANIEGRLTSSLRSEIRSWWRQRRLRDASATSEFYSQAYFLENVEEPDGSRRKFMLHAYWTVFHSQSEPFWRHDLAAQRGEPLWDQSSVATKLAEVIRADSHSRDAQWIDVFLPKDSIFAVPIQLETDSRGEPLGRKIRLRIADRAYRRRDREWEQKSQKLSDLCEASETVNVDQHQSVVLLPGQMPNDRAVASLVQLFLGNSERLAVEFREGSEPDYAELSKWAGKIVVDCAIPVAWLTLEHDYELRAKIAGWRWELFHQYYRAHREQHGRMVKLIWDSALSTPPPRVLAERSES